MMNVKIIRMIFVVGILFSISLFASQGKIRGTIIDKETGMPVSQAEVRIENYSLEAITDQNGEYILLNVPAGSYTIIVHYADYGEIRFENVVVRAELTTYQDLILSGEDRIIQVNPVRIEKDETGDIQTFRGEEIERMPLREVEDVLSIMTGVVHLDDNFHIRGGRHDELGWVVDGFNVSDAFDGDRMIPIIPNAIEEVSLRAGNFPAEYGGKISGMADITLKTGGPRYKLTGEIISDDFWAFKDERGSYEILGIDKLYSYGYSDYVLTASGPVLPKYDKLRFFIAGQRRNRLSDATWFQGFYQDSLQLIGKWTTWHYDQIIDTLDLYLDVPPGRLPGGGSSDLTFQGNLLWDFKPFRIKVGGTWHQSRSTPQTSEPQGFVAIGTRDPRTHTGSWNGYFHLTHTISPTFYYSLSGSYTKKHWESGDPLIGWDKDSWIDWGDPTKNPTLIDTSKARDWYSWDLDYRFGGYPLPFDRNFRIMAEGSPVYIYKKGEEEKYFLRFDLTKQLSKRHEFSLGGEYQQYKYRRFQIRARDYLKRLRDVASNPEAYSEFDIYYPLVQMWGYDWFGNKIEEDMIVVDNIGKDNPVQVNLGNAPPTPLYGGLYINDRVAFNDLVMNIGVRLDHFNNGVPSLKDVKTLTEGQNERIAEENWNDSKKFTYLSPRLGFYFPVSNELSFYTNLGNYSQSQSLNQIWLSKEREPLPQYYLYSLHHYLCPNPNIKPTKTTSFEIGTQYQFHQSGLLNFMAFYNNIFNQAHLHLVHPIPEGSNYPYLMYLNCGNSTIKGVSASLIFRSGTHITLNFNYMYQYTEGTYSVFDNYADEYRCICGYAQHGPFPSEFPNIPSDNDISQSGIILFNYQTFTREGFSILGYYPVSNMNLQLKIQWHSGKPYSPIAREIMHWSESQDEPWYAWYSEVYGYHEPQYTQTLNSARLPWFFQLDGKLDKSFHIGPVKFNVYLWAINILGTKGIIDGFRQTGRPDTDGWLGTLSGQEKIEEAGEYAEDYIKWYNAILTGCGTFGYQQPRQVRLGVKFEIF